MFARMPIVAVVTAGLVLAGPFGPHARGAADEPAAYVVNEIHVTDAAKFKTYAAAVPGTLKPFGGVFVVRGGSPEGWSGAAPAERVVILQFPSRTNAKAWHDSAAYQTILPIRDASSTSRVYVVDAAGPSP